MPKKKQKATYLSNFRQRAEGTLEPSSVDNGDPIKLSPDDMKATIHDLQVHQIELEMQNDELKRSENELDTARARYFDLYDFAPVGYVTLSETGMILETNLTAATLLRKERKELAKQPVSMFILKEDQDIYYLHRKQLFETGEPQTCELRMVRPGGPPFWARLDTTAARNKDGSPICRVVIIDITERKQTDEALSFLSTCGLPSTGEDFFLSLARYLAKTLGMGYVCIDSLEGDGLTAKTVAIYNNGRFESNMTYALKDTPCGEVVSKGVCCYPKDVRQLFPQYAALQELMAESYFGTTLVDSKGRLIGLIAIIGRHPIGDPKWAESLLRAVTLRAAGELERRNNEEALRSEKEFTRKVLESSLNGLYIYDLEQLKFAYINPQYTVLTGYSLENLNDISSEKFSELFHADDLPKIQQHISDISQANDNEVLEIEYQFKHLNGEWIWLISKDAVFTRNLDGTVKEFIGTFLDITYRKKGEMQIQNALKEKETLLKELYHRTKNNMQVIMAMINLQTQNIKDENILQMFNETSNRISTMALVHEKLYQTKDLSQINLKDYFTDLINLLSNNYQLISEGIKIKTDMSNVMVTIDSAIPCGLIMNELISNAFKHAFPENQSGEIQISLKMIDDQEIELIIGDDGIGLPEGFEYRDTDTIGLQTIVALAEGQLLGTLKVAKGKGTKFHITFREMPHKKRI